MSERVDAETAGAVRHSPWPLLVALGLAASELGILVGSVPLVVFGLVLFGGCSAGLVSEAGYGTSPARPMQVVGGVLVVAGGALWLSQVPAPTAATLLAPHPTNAVVQRGVAGVLAGGLLVALGTVGGRLSALR